MRRVKFSFFPVLLVVSYVLVAGSFDPLWMVGFSLLHELGHWLAARMLGGGVRRFFGGGQGFALEIHGLSYQRELAVVLAGPAVNLLLAAALSGNPFFVFANLALAGMNLLPILPLDGGRALRCLLLLRMEPHRCGRILQGLALAFLLPLLGLSFWLFLSSGYNISLLLVSFYLLFLIKENGYDV